MEHPCFQYLGLYSRLVTQMVHQMIAGLSLVYQGQEHLVRAIPTCYKVMKNFIYLSGSIDRDDLKDHEGMEYLVLGASRQTQKPPRIFSASKMSRSAFHTPVPEHIEGLYLVPDGNYSLDHYRDRSDCGNGRGLATYASEELLVALFRQGFGSAAMICQLLNTHRYDLLQKVDVCLDGYDRGILKYIRTPIEKEHYISRMLFLVKSSPKSTEAVLREPGPLRIFISILSGVAKCWKEIRDYLLKLQNFLDFIRGILTFPNQELLWSIPVDEWPDVLNLTPIFPGALVKACSGSGQIGTD